MSAQRLALLKSAAKLLLFFEICKKICTFDADLEFLMQLVAVILDYSDLSVSPNGNSSHNEIQNSSVVISFLSSFSLSGGAYAP